MEERRRIGLPDYESMILERQEGLEIFEDDPDWDGFTEEERWIFRRMMEDTDAD